jgi:hypothetical protein
MLTFLKNIFVNYNRYREHPQAVIISCFFNPQKSPYRTKSFTQDLDSVYDWSKEFEKIIDKKIAYTYGELYHIWHGDIEKRQYLKRIQDYTVIAKEVTQKDNNGLYTSNGSHDEYVRQYFEHREVKPRTQTTTSHMGTYNHSHGTHINTSAGYDNASENFS